MRPIKLTLQAFGPFAGEVVLDFRAALDQRLFGIYGPTGSGKTSILDGICFALFGQSSGEERQAPQLRSDHAADDVPTEATLIFEVGAKRYYIRRSPAQAISGRGGKLTARQHTADLFDVTDLAIDEVSPENCGVPLAERKTGEVEAKVHELLGYSADQFRQVVLLPQGKFRKLLTANSKDRSEVLRGLFDVSIYGRFAARLKLEADGLKTDVETTEALIRGSLADQSLGSREDLELAISLIEQDLIEIGNARAEAETALSLANAAFEEGKHRGEKFSQLALARSEREKLQARSAEINTQRARGAAAARAKAVQPVVEEAARASRAKADAASRLEARLTEEARANSGLQAAQAALAASTAAEGERAKLTTHRIQLNAIVQRLAAAAPLADELKRAQAAEGEAQRIAELAVKTSEAARLQQDAARNAVEAAIVRGGEIAELRSRLRDLELEEKASEAYRLSLLRLRSLEVAAEKAATFHAAKKTAADVARAAHNEAERILAEAQAAHLAAKLEDGVPCPVCGSPSHPNPATGGVLAAGRDEAFRQTQATLQACDADERLANEALITAKTQAEGQRQNHEALPTPERPSEIIKDDLQGAKGRLDQLERLPGKEAELVALTAAEARAKSALEYLDQRSKALMDAKTASASANARLQNELSTVPAELRIPADAQRALQLAQEAESRATKAHADAMELEQKAGAQLALETNNVAHAREVLANAEKSDRSAQVRLDQALSEAGLTLAEFEAARVDIPSLEALQASVLTYDKACTAAEARVQSAEEAAAGVEPPDMDVLEAARREANLAQQAVVEKGAAALSRQSTLNNLHASILAKEALIVAKRQRYELVGELSDLSSGKNDKRLRLQDFAIMATFEDVLEAANLRFEKMSRGRYSLIRKEDLSRSVSGLEIQVFDAQTEKARDAGTVSGGEGFLASLSLALGLSDVIQSESGGIKLDAIFIDEGFDQLDSDTLDLALTTLSDLVASDRAIGMISHVDAVKETIPAAFQLRHGLKGSVLEPQLGHEA